MGSHVQRRGEALRRAFSSFLAIPTAMTALFALLALGTYGIDQWEVGPFPRFHRFMEGHVFGDSEATSNLLGTIAGGVITITSITFSLLLIALQQSAGSLTEVVFDQFLRRKANQVFFGFFVGLTLFSLITLATVAPPFNPVLGATTALALTVVALYVLLLLIYSTISQMRPTNIVQAIHDHTLKARERQLDLVRRTRPIAQLPHLAGIPVVAKTNGFIDVIHLDVIERALGEATGPVEIDYQLSIGSFVAYGDTYAEVRAERSEDGQRMVDVVMHATNIDFDRDLGSDPAFGIEQMTNIAWRSISTSQQNPAPGLATIDNLHDLLARWAGSAEDGAQEGELPVVYCDNVRRVLIDAFETLTVVASEAMQHQIFTAVTHALTRTFERLPAVDQRRVEELWLRSLAGLGDHVLTSELDEALTTLERTLERANRYDALAAVRTAHEELAQSIGKLNSRATRVPTKS